MCFLNTRFFYSVRAIDWKVLSAERLVKNSIPRLQKTMISVARPPFSLSNVCYSVH